MIKIIETVITKDKRHKYKVICTDCGYRFQVRVSRYSEEASCKRCSTIQKNIEKAGEHRGKGELSRTFFNYFRNTAGRRGVAFTVTLEYLESIWTGECAITKLPLNLPQRTDSCGNCSTDYNTASLDRIDSTLPYQEGNVQWVHKHINIMKNGYSMEEFVWLCHRVASCHADQQPSVLKGNKKVSTKVQRLGSEDYQPITSPRVPDTSRGDDIVRHSQETGRAQDKEPECN